jgi:uncharacterized SAM-binding protein YcdF (DUF218 family)
VEEKALMFFFLSKTVAYLLLPSNLFIALGLVGLALCFTRWRRAGARIGLGSTFILLTFAFLPVGNVLLNALENRFPAWDAAHGVPDGIIVLGGSIDPDASLDRGRPVVSSAPGRLIAIALLARQFPSSRIIYSGGNGSLIPGKPAEAEFIYPLLDAFGVSRARVVLESRSRNTEENAVFTKAIANPKPGERWLLVTSAWHMPRAVGCFRRIGFPVEAYPTDWQTLRDVRLVPSFEPAKSLVNTDTAAHEWLGLLAYWLTGRSSELLPGP